MNDVAFTFDYAQLTISSVLYQTVCELPAFWQRTIFEIIKELNDTFSISDYNMAK